MLRPGRPPSVAAARRTPARNLPPLASAAGRHRRSVRGWRQLPARFGPTEASCRRAWAWTWGGPDGRASLTIAGPDNSVGLRARSRRAARQAAGRRASVLWVRISSTSALASSAPSRQRPWCRWRAQRLRSRSRRHGWSALPSAAALPSRHVTSTVVAGMARPGRRKLVPARAEPVGGRADAAVTVGGWRRRRGRRAGSPRDSGAGSGIPTICGRPVRGCRGRGSWPGRR